MLQCLILKSQNQHHDLRKISASQDWLQLKNLPVNMASFHYAPGYLSLTCCKPSFMKGNTSEEANSA